MGKVIGGGLPAAALGGTARADAACSRRPATSTRQARCRATRSRSPPAWRRCGCSTSRPTRAFQRPRSGSRTGCARPPGTLDARSQVPHAGLLTVFFAAEPVHDFAVGQACDLEAFGTLLASCSRAACIRRRRSSRRGSRRWRTPSATWSTTLEAAREALCGSGGHMRSARDGLTTLCSRCALVAAGRRTCSRMAAVEATAGPGAARWRRPGPRATRAAA